jgi:hypothetical protein
METTLLPTQAAKHANILRGYFQSPEGLFRQQYYEAA